MPNRILTVIGARPQFVKAAAVSRALMDSPQLEEILLHTGQHFDHNMSGLFFADLGLPNPAYNLGINGGTHGQNTGRTLEAIEAVLQHECPDIVLVYGDTDSTLAGALAAAKLNIPVAHIEAGLRSYNRKMPEEINRLIADHVAKLAFAPTVNAANNLALEGISDRAITVTGDVMLDAFKLFIPLAQRRSTVLDTLGLRGQEYVLLTIHRQENTDDLSRLEGILRGVSMSGRRTVFPAHPRTKLRLTQAGLVLPASITLVDPVGYLDMLMLESGAALIATDSGGVQKEAYFHGVPCLTLRDETEWIELVEIGANRVVGVESIEISKNMDWSVADLPRGIYGDGHASERICDVLCRELELTP